MTVAERPLAAVCDGVAIGGSAFFPDTPRAALVLLHGIPSVAPPEPGDDGYPGLARRLAVKGYACAWADLRAVRTTPGAFSIEGWVRDARAVIDAVKALAAPKQLPLAVVGSSAGAVVALEAVSRGAEVDALVLLAAPAAWVSFAGDPRAGVERIVTGAGMAVAPEVLADPRAWAAEFDSVTAERAVRTVAAPVLILHGTADDVVPPDHAARLAAAAPCAEVRMLEGAGHQLRRDELALDAALKWLDGVLVRP